MLLVRLDMKTTQKLSHTASFVAAACTPPLMAFLWFIPSICFINGMKLIPDTNVAVLLYAFIGGPVLLRIQKFWQEITFSVWRFIEENSTYIVRYG